MPENFMHLGMTIILRAYKKKVNFFRGKEMKNLRLFSNTSEEIFGIE